MEKRREFRNETNFFSVMLINWTILNRYVAVRTKRHI